MRDDTIVIENSDHRYCRVSIVPYTFCLYDPRLNLHRTCAPNLKKMASEPTSPTESDHRINQINIHSSPSTTCTTPLLSPAPARFGGDPLSPAGSQTNLEERRGGLVTAKIEGLANPLARFRSAALLTNDRAKST